MKVTENSYKRGYPRTAGRYFLPSIGNITKYFMQ